MPGSPSLGRMPRLHVSKNKSRKADFSRQKRLVLFLRSVVAGFVGLFLAFSPVVLGHADASPDLANYYLDWSLNEAMVRELAKWDVIVLEMENQVRNPEMIRRLRELNPKIKIVAYITSQEIRQDAATGQSVMRKKLVSGIRDEWYLYDTSGNKLSYWPGTNLLNVTEKCPTVDGMKFNKYLSLFAANEILSTGLWDGVFYDNGWSGVSWFSKDRADLDRDGVAETNVDEEWKRGMKFIFNETRRITGNNYLILSNQGPGHREYRDELNGIMIESFPSFGWKYTMEVFDYQQNGTPNPRVMIINSNTKNTGKKENYREMRYGLASSLLGQAYFSFDHGDQEHAQLWWYDEYGIKLGTPVSVPISAGNKNKYDEDVWKREYSNGIALVNPTGKPVEVDLGGEYEKIIGTQDKAVNNGLITDRVTLGPKDGLLMLKTYQKVEGTVFNNGGFLRFYKQNGERARNGFFGFDESAPGGAAIYEGDINGDGAAERVIAAGNRLEVRKASGERVFMKQPFGAKFKGTLNLAVGKLFPDSLGQQILVASPANGKVMMYNYDGSVLEPGITPYGAKYAGGFSVAIGNVDGGNAAEIILGSGRGRTGEILVYDYRLEKIKKRFIPYDKRYTGGLTLASGDMNGDGLDEIVALPQKGNALVRFFNALGKKTSEFRLNGFFGGGSEVKLSTADVNKDGLKELVVINGQ